MSEPTTPEPPSAIAPGTSIRKAILKTGRQIRDTPIGALMPWMQAYAEWLCLECLERPTATARMTRARGLARAPINYGHLRLLEARTDFVAYCTELQKGPLEQARARFASAFPTYVEAHRKALDIAVETKDVAGIARLAEPVLDRIYPKKTEGGAAPMVQIVLAPSQLAGVRAYIAPEMTVDDVVVVEEEAS